MRVVALLPAATEIVLALGAGEWLVGVTHACVLPRPLAHLPRLTGSRVPEASAVAVDAGVRGLAEAGEPLFDLDQATLTSLRPDVILTQATCEVCAVRESDVRAVARRLAPLPVIVTLGASSVDGVLEDIQAVGAALDLPDEAEELVAGLRSRMRSIHRELKARQAPRPRVTVIEWTDPPFCAGHWVPDMVRRAGGVELLGATGSRSRSFDAAEAAALAPEVLIVAPCGVGLEGAVRQGAEMLGREAWAWARSTPAFAIDAAVLTSSPGPGVVHGIEVLARVMHGTIFGEPDPRTARRLQ